MNTNEIVYVCYVLDSYAALENEDVISCLTLTKSQAGIDNWLDCQLEEAKENGYEPEEEPEQFKGLTNYTLAVRKGNDKEGYDEYYFVCRPEVIK